MKKILIVNNNMKIGGVQKSLCNFLWTFHKKYEITLFLFYAEGEYMEELPEDVRVLHCHSLFRFLGMSQGECRKRPKDYMVRGLLALLCKIFGRNFIMPLIEASQKPLKEEYDAVVSYLQNGFPHNFYGGVNEFVLHKTKGTKKIAFLHCDYKNCGSNTEKNNLLYGEFDKIAACSTGCRNSFVSAVPALAERCCMQPNCHRYAEIRDSAESFPQSYDKNKAELLMVSRLSHEKGVERAIAAVVCGLKQGIPVRLHIVGGGPKEEKLKELVRKENAEKDILFYGNQKNPYRFMKNADLLFITSYHEAAPMVIDEAACLGLPVLSTETTSAREMILDRGCGWVCGNTQEEIETALLELLKHPEVLKAKKEKMKMISFDNKKADVLLEKLLNY